MSSRYRELDDLDDRSPTGGGSLTAVGEWRNLWSLARHSWVRGQRPWLGVSLGAATALVSLMLRLHIASPVLWRSGDVYASLPLSSELARLPMSTLFPTPYLPMWAACGQLLVVIGLGELILGRWLTMMVAVGAHFGATLLARVLLDTVHGSAFGLSHVLVHVLDTGPSAATTAVGACLLIGARMNRCAMLLGASLIVAAIVAPGVDGVEHTVALAYGVGAGAFFRVAVSTRTSQFLSTWRLRIFRAPSSLAAFVRDRRRLARDSFS